MHQRHFHLSGKSDWTPCTIKSSQHFDVSFKGDVGPCAAAATERRYCKKSGRRARVCAEVL